MTYRIRIAQFLNEDGRKLAPEIKKLVRQALKEVAENPFLGKPLNDELVDFHSYHVLRYRIVYKIKIREKVVTVRAIAHRSVVYERLAEHLARMGPDDMD